MLAAAAQGVIQAAQTQWFLHGGDLATMISEGLEVLETRHRHRSERLIHQCAAIRCARSRREPRPREV